jgi:cob(I)alamin adenosyltransferase
VLILDELLGILDEKVVTEDEVRELLAGRPEDMTLICTGRVLNGAIRECADEIYHIALEK